MEQLTLFPPPYKYIIDASSLFAQKPTDTFPRLVHKSLWEAIEKNIKEKNNRHVFGNRGRNQKR